MNSSKIPNYSPNSFNLLSFLTKSGVSVIFMVGLFFLFQTSNKIMEGLKNLLPTVTNDIDTSKLIVQKIQGVSELTTTVFVMDAVIPTSSSRRIGDWVVGETNLLYLARGEVRAGLDLSKIEENNIRVENDTLTITLPAPQILDSKIDVTKSQVYDYDRGFLSLGPDVAPDLQTQAQRETLKKVVNSACDAHILTQANQRAVLTITQLMENTGYDSVNVKTTPSKECKG
ncbi:DUF4230 domain-containing protein [Cyanobacterium stanieri LEGE 03274]|uniref:DUF4230 domain-containing protein n=1 Tax=Cyanobacterium stanieri LEGE 03274 TaxID=1828756 RepID=A0ABR9V7K8_9CHRO|nr:DUF4230 domain-containing protein [Cyanobacterium stanieri]MBE9222799.1 DUF4230 domain-containing protein [Cyanobacterium stanieri LEGE 03274]